MAAPFKIRRSRQLVGFASLALIALLTLVRGQAKREGVPDALSLLERAARRYSDLKSYRITRQEFFASDQPSNPSPSKMTAVEAPGGRYRFEGDDGWGKAVQVCDGHWVWYYRPTENAYTRRPATGKKPDLPEALAPGDGDIKGAADLHDMTWLAGVFKSAKWLPEARLTFKGKSVDSYVVQVSNDDRKIPLPYPFTDRIWIEKGSLKIRKIAEYYTATLNRPGLPPVTFPATRISIYPEVVLNEPMPDTEFQFIPPASAQRVIEFSDRARVTPEPRTTGRKLPDLVFTAQDGSKLRLESLRGHPVLIDLWATWCGPCVEAFPDLARLYPQTRSIGLVFLSIDIADDATIAQSYMEKMHYPWQNFHDDGEIGKAFGPSAVPRTVIINSNGESVFDKVSPTMDELRAVIEKLASEFAKSAGS
jgi:thiol-disulfide isomerase/thioredoxin